MVARREVATSTTNTLANKLPTIAFYYKNQFKEILQLHSKLSTSNYLGNCNIFSGMSFAHIRLLGAKKLVYANTLYVLKLIFF